MAAPVDQTCFTEHILPKYAFEGEQLAKIRQMYPQSLICMADGIPRVVLSHKESETENVKAYFNSFWKNDDARTELSHDLIKQVVETLNKELMTDLEWVFPSLCLLFWGVPSPCFHLARFASFFGSIGQKRDMREAIRPKELSLQIENCRRLDDRNCIWYHFGNWQRECIEWSSTRQLTPLISLMSNAILSKPSSRSTEPLRFSLRSCTNVW